MYYLNEFSKKPFSRWDNDITHGILWACFVPRTGKKGQLGPARQSPTLCGILSVSHSLCCFGTCSCQHMLPGSVRCHCTAVKWGGREKQKEKHGRARKLNARLQGAGEQCQLKGCKNKVLWGKDVKEAFSPKSQLCIRKTVHFKGPCAEYASAKLLFFILLFELLTPQSNFFFFFENNP